LSQLNANSPRSVSCGPAKGAISVVVLFKAYQSAYVAEGDAMERVGYLGECMYGIEKTERWLRLSPLHSSLLFGSYLLEYDGLHLLGEIRANVKRGVGASNIISRDRDVESTFV
jgi:hypothetical protein